MKSSGLAIALLALALALAAAAQPAVPEWLLAAAAGPVRLSPDGSRLAWARGRDVFHAPVDAIDEAVRRAAPGFVEGLWWIGGSGLLIRSSTNARERLDFWNGKRLAEVLAVPREGRRRLTVISASEERILFAADHRRGFAPDVYAVAPGKGGDLQPRLLERNPGTVFSWLVDDRGELAAAHRWRPAASGIRYEWLVDRAGRWQVVRGFELGDPEERVLRVSERGLLIARAEASGSAVRWFDPLARELGPPVWAGNSQILDVVDALATGPPGLVSVEAERRQLVPQGSYWPARVAALRAAYPDHEPVLLGRSGGDETLLWKLFNDRDPGQYVVQHGNGRLTRLFAARANLPVDQALPMLPFRFTAADGLALDGYVTGAGADRPAVVLVHGGPWARDSWQFQPEAQFLAGLGYAVIQVNYRGSDGLGAERLRAGRREWGRAMQTDLLDGIAAAADAGWIDPARVCVMGASYGGYAALMGVLEHPEDYRCAISRAPVTDLPAYLARMRLEGNRRGYLEWREMVGPPGALRGLSPLARSRALARPVLVAHGTRDLVVPAGHGQRFAAASELATFLPLDAGHLLREPAARKTYYAAVARFLAEHLGTAVGSE